MFFRQQSFFSPFFSRCVGIIRCSKLEFLFDKKEFWGVW
uniref:Uncharacterized protein n=1 Tax=Arundo donax TaxID=35708 RepID=A0A0A9C8B4_ARUDO